MLAIIEVLIGLAFIYGLFSVLVSAATELLLAVWSQRGRVLWGSVQGLLPGTSQTRVPDADGLANPLHGRDMGDDVCAEFLRHPLIAGLGAKQMGGKVHFPSYVPPHVFVDTLLHMLRSGSIRRGKVDTYGEMRELIDDVSNPKLRHTLQALYMSALDSGMPFRLRLEQWFNDSMDRATGAYKRHAHIVMFLTAFILAGVCNVDTLKIIAVLSTNTEMRKSIADTAKDYLGEMQKAAVTQLKEGLKEVEQQEKPAALRLPPPTGVVAPLPSAPAGGGDALLNQVEPVVQAEAPLSKEAQVIETKVGEFSSALSQMNDFGLPIGWTARGGLYATVFAPLAIVGWLLSALAATLGANFWFHILGSLVKMRLTGRKPDATGTASATMLPASAAAQPSATGAPVGMIPAGPGYAALSMDAIVPPAGHGLEEEPQYTDDAHGPTV
jgi:hypothetical protein